MKFISIVSLQLCLLLVIGGSVYARQQTVSDAGQDSAIHINTIVERTQALLEVYPIEKVHLHFDKPYYAVGDTVWFKGYLTTNLFNYESSKIMYVEVMTARDSLIQTLKLPITDFTARGQLVLDQKWFGQGNYRFRAYTKWMGNFDPAYFFNKVVPVGDVLNQSLHTQVRFDSKGEQIVAALQFFDRGGRVLAGSRVNWEATSEAGTLAKGKGETDAMGNLTITVNGKDKKQFENGILHLSLQETRVGGSLLVGNLPLRSAIWEVDVQFFPEGGDLIAGISKKIAFKAVGSDGLGVPVEGTVSDRSGQVVATIKDIHAGMGYFFLSPEKGNAYRANLSFANGETRRVDLPEVEPEGIALTVQGQNEQKVRLVMVANQEYLEKNRDKQFNIIAQAEGALSYAAQATLKSEAVVIDLPKDRFPTGIAQLVLFNPHGTPLSERLVFIESLTPIDIQVRTDKAAYPPKGLVSLSLTTLNNDTTFAGHYSISVTDEQKVPFDENDEQTILSNFLLTSNIKGYVEAPNYYFNPANTDREEAMEALLLTQGYKRFSYVDLLAGNYPQLLFMPEQGIEISGTLRYNNGRPVEGGGLLLSIPDRSFRKDIYTDENGRFHFSGLVFTDSARVTINARGNENYRNMVIHVDQTNYPGIDRNVRWADGELNIDLALRPYLDNSRKVFRTDVLIDEVQIKATSSPSRSHKEYPSISGLSTADHQISADRLKGHNNLLNAFRTVLTGITYDSQLQQFFITRDYNAGGRIPVQFFVNGTAVDVVSLNGILPNEVQGVDIFLKDELGLVSRVHQNNGVVSVYTVKKQDVGGARMSLAEIERLFPKANVVDLNPLGYLKEYTFYSPKYDTPESQAVNDLRSTIYWNPAVVTDEQGKASLSFYNADGRGTYRVVIEGTDASGNIGRTVYRYRVN